MEEGNTAVVLAKEATSSSTSSSSTGLSKGQKVILITAALGLTGLGLLARHLRKRLMKEEGKGSSNSSSKGGGVKGRGGIVDGFAKYLRPSGSIRSSSSTSPRPHSRPLPGPGGDTLANHKGQRQSSISSSILTQSTLVSLDPTLELDCTQLGILGMETLDKSLSFWEESLHLLKQEGEGGGAHVDEDTRHRTIAQLEEIINSGKHLQHLAQELYLDEESVLYAESERASTSYGRGRLRSVSSVESFMSAEDVLSDDEEIRQSLENAGFIPMPGDGVYPLYEAAMRLVEAGAVPYRSLKTDMLTCKMGDQEYLAKLHCLRGAFSRIVSNVEKRNWICSKGKEVFSQIMLKGDKDPFDFELSLDTMVSWCEEPSNWGILELELKDRGLRALTFYDIVLDYILLDAFEDLENPPLTVLTVVQNRWLSNTFKETALGTAIWSVLKTKRKWLRYKDGFIGHFYNLSDYIMPTLAWGFLGPQSDLQDLCFFFKDKFLDFLRSLFSFEDVRYTTLDELSEDVMKRLEEMHSLISHRIAEIPTPSP